jgi:hypothetical protein
MSDRLTQSNYDEMQAFVDDIAIARRWSQPDVRLVGMVQTLLDDINEREREKKRLKQLLTEVHSRMVRGGTQTVDVRLPCDVLDEIWEVIK